MSNEKKVKSDILLEADMSNTPVTINKPINDLFKDIKDVAEEVEEKVDDDINVESNTSESSPYTYIPGRSFISNYNDLRTRGGTLAYKYAEALKAELKELAGFDPNFEDINVDVIDKTDSSIKNAQRLMYSAVVCSIVTAEGIVFYTLVIQDAKYKDVLTFGDYTNRRLGGNTYSNANFLNKNNPNDVYTPDQCVDSIYYRVIGDFLLSKYLNLGENLPLVNKNAVVIYNSKNVSNKDIENKVKDIVNHVYNTIRNGAYSVANDDWDLTLPDFGGSNFHITGSNYVIWSSANRETNQHTIMDLNGFPIRSDFTVKLDYVERQDKRQIQYGNIGYNGNETPFGNTSTLNTGDQTQDLTMIHGYIDPIVKIAQPYQQQVGDRIITRSRDIIPNVVLTNISTSNTTLGYSLLAIISSFGVITNDKLVGIMNIHTKSNNVGALNIYCDITGESATTNELKPLNLYTKDRKNVSADDYAANYNAARYIFHSPVVLSIDVPVAGFETSYLSPFSAATAVEPERLAQGVQLITAGVDVADNDYDQTNIAAAMAAYSIVKTAHILTNGKFPLDYPITDIFVGKHMLIPNGYFMEKNTARDIREVDLAYVINESSLNTELINKWSVCSNGSSFNKSNIYDEKAEVISKLLPNAVFTGLSARVTFTSKFLTSLYSAIVANGFNPIDNSTIMVPVSSVAFIAAGGVTSNYYDNAGFTFNGNFFTTQGGMMTANSGFSTAGLYSPGQIGAERFRF